MDRRSLLKALPVVAAATVAGTAHSNTPKLLETRKTFKLVDMGPRLIVIKAGTEDWEPSVEDLTQLLQAVEAAEIDRDSLVCRRDVDVSVLPNYAMIGCSMMDLKVGDTFVMYEDVTAVQAKPGEKVPGVWKCSGVPYLNLDGVPTVHAEEVVNHSFQIPNECPV